MLKVCYSGDLIWGDPCRSKSHPGRDPEIPCHPAFLTTGTRKSHLTQRPSLQDFLLKRDHHHFPGKQDEGRCHLSATLADRRDRCPTSVSPARPLHSRHPHKKSRRPYLDLLKEPGTRKQTCPEGELLRQNITPISKTRLGRFLPVTRQALQ